MPDTEATASPRPGPPPHGANLPDGWYAWADGWRDDRGLACGGVGAFRFGLLGLDPKQSAAFLGRLSISVQAPDAAAPYAAPGRALWRKVRGQWGVEIDIADGARVADALVQARRPVLGRAIEALLPVWTAARDEALAAEVEADRVEAVRVAEAAEGCGVPVDTYRQAEEVARALQRLARATDKEDPAYYARCVPVVARLLADGIAPGQDKGTVYDSTTHAEVVTWRWLGPAPAAHDGPERLGLRIGPGAGDVGDWKRTIPGAIDDPDTGLVVIDGRQTLRVSRILERRSLAAALALRTALCLDSTKERRRDLALLAAAGTFAEIPDPEVRRFARGVGASVPLPAGLELREYQVIGVAFLVANGFRGLLGDAMGLGKTPQAIATLLYGYASLLPAVVVAPAAMIFTWQLEIRRFAPWLDPVVVTDTTAELAPANPRRVWIVSADMLAALEQDLAFEAPQMLVLDEAHLYKNPQAKRSQAAASLARVVPHVVELSGTAAENHVGELWHLLHILDPNEFPSRDDFNHRYKNLRSRVVERKGLRGRVEMRTFIDDAGGDLHAELRHRLRYHMVRRRKTDVLSELPPKTRAPLWVSLDTSTMAAYRKAEGEVARYLLGVARERAVAVAVAAFRAAVAAGATPRDAATSALAAGNAAGFNEEGARNRTMALWRFIGPAKASAALSWIANRRAADGGDGPLVVFVWHQDVLKALLTGLAKLAAQPQGPLTGLRFDYIDGGVSAKKRFDRVHAFQTGQLDVLIGTKALYQGVTLTAAMHMLFVEQWWNPAWMEQAEDRIHRIGQSAPVLITHLLAKGTVDEHVSGVLAVKRETMAAVLGAETVLDGTGGEAAGEVSEVVADVGARFLASVTARLGGDADVVPRDAQGRVVLVTASDLRRALGATLQGEVGR